MLSLFSILLTSTFIALVSHVYYERYLHPLSKIPGPFFASISRLYLVYNSLKLQRNKLEITLHQKYGPIVRISPNEISVSDPKCIKQIYGAAHPFLKSRWYEPIESKDPEGMNLLGEVDMDKYRHQRRLIGPCFTTDAIKRRETLLDRPLRKFVLKMEEMGGKPIDLVKWMNILALDLLTEICFAESPDYVTAGEDQGNARDIDIFWKQIQWVGLVPDFWAGYVYVAEIANRLGIPLPVQKSTSGLAIIQVSLYPLLLLVGYQFVNVSLSTISLN
jgi:cytochrome P450